MAECNEGVPQIDVHSCLEDALDITSPLDQPIVDAGRIGLGIDIMQGGYLPVVQFAYNPGNSTANGTFTIDYEPSTDRIYWRPEFVSLANGANTGLVLELYLKPKVTGQPRMLIYHHTTTAVNEDIIVPADSLPRLIKSDQYSLEMEYIGGAGDNATPVIIGYYVPYGINLP